MKCTLYLITCDLRSPCQLCRGLKVMFPPQHYSFFLPSLWFPITLYPRGLGQKQICIHSTETCKSRVASCTSKISRAITGSGPVAQTWLPRMRTICTPLPAFHSPGLWASPSKPCSFTSQLYPFFSSKLLLKIRTIGINASRQPLHF